MLYDIQPHDFAHHVRHAKSWSDLGIRCGLEPDHCKESMLQQKVHNMRLNVDHFVRQKNLISDDDFKTIVKESNYVYEVVRKCNKAANPMEKERILKRIENLGIDITHFKTKRRSTAYPCVNKLDAIDDETFKTLVKNNRTWTDLILTCGYKRDGGSQKKVSIRIEKLGLDTNHFDIKVTPTDKVFVVDSQYTFISAMKKRLVRDFDMPYECAACKNEHFTKCDGVLMWNNKEIVLQLEHKNDINNDNRIENLEFLCPPCHSQTSTFTGRNNKKYKAGQTWLEEGKTCHAPGSIASLLN